MPSKVVGMNPEGLLGPGESHLATTPAMKPTMIIRMMLPTLHIFTSVPVGKNERRPPAGIAARPQVIALFKLLFDRSDDTGVGRFDLRGETRGDLAIAADQVFVEVPPRRIERPLAGHPFVERMGIGTADLGLCGDREAGAVLVLGGLRDVDG